MINDITQLGSKLAIEFRDLMLIENAFVHRSYLNESKKFKESNERLEYLGDAVLELATSKFLYIRYPEYQEGMLTNLRASLVRTESLASVSLDMQLDQLLLMSKGEEATGGKSNTSLLANTFEAFLGAVYLDQGYDTCVQILEQYLFPNIDKILEKASYKDSKSKMQEIAQAKFHETPKYQLLDEVGPDHDKVFTVAAMIGDRQFGVGQGKSKQEAQESAARATLEILQES